MKLGVGSETNGHPGGTLINNGVGMGSETTGFGEESTTGSRNAALASCSSASSSDLSSAGPGPRRAAWRGRRRNDGDAHCAPQQWT